MTTPIKLNPSQLVSDQSSIGGCVPSNVARNLPGDNQKHSAVAKTEEIIYDRGRPVNVAGIQIDDKRLIVQGRFLTVARLKDEWYDELGNPESVIAALKKYQAGPDIFTFWQRLPDTLPIYSYYHETEVLSAIPLKNFQHWWEKQIASDTRKKAKRPEKRGVQIKVVALDDAFVRGVMGIFNETPVRRGRPFWHYGKDFETLKHGLSRDLDRSKFIGAYDGGNLVGFVKLVCAEGRFANPGLIVSKLEARKKYVNNALLAKAVELCCQDRIPYLTYTVWRRGSQAEFLMRHGFQKTLVPRYWIPLTRKGAIALKLGLHHNIRHRIPDWLMRFLLDMRGRVNATRYKLTRPEVERGLDSLPDGAGFGKPK
jgi:hypothetical protein